MSRRRISAASWSNLLRRTQPPESSANWEGKVHRITERNLADLQDTKLWRAVKSAFSALVFDLARPSTTRR